MKKDNKNLLKTIISNQELIMKALNINIPVNNIEENAISAKQTAVKKTPVKKITSKLTVKKAPSKTLKK